MVSLGQQAWVRMPLISAARLDTSLTLLPGSLKQGQDSELLWGARTQALIPANVPGVPATGEPSPALRSSTCPLKLQGLHRCLGGLPPSGTGAVPGGGVLEAERDGRDPPLVETPF